jgi:hypothetical protein
MYLMTTTAKGAMLIGPFENQTQVESFFESAAQRDFARDKFSQAMTMTPGDFLGRFAVKPAEPTKEPEPAKEPAVSAKPEPTQTKEYGAAKERGTHTDPKEHGAQHGAHTGRHKA